MCDIKVDLFMPKARIHYEISNTDITIVKFPYLFCCYMLKVNICRKTKSIQYPEIDLSIDVLIYGVLLTNVFASLNGHLPSIIRLFHP